MGRRRTRTGLSVLVTAALGSIAWASPAHALPPDCGELVIDDPLAGATVGQQSGGSLDAAGFTPGADGGSIVWNLDAPLRYGCVELTVEGFSNVGLGEHDFLELFTGPDGSFSDRAVDYFLLYKIAGDVYPDVDGAVKVELGLEFDVLEVGTWSDLLAWDPAQPYTLAIKLADDGTVSFYRDDVLLAGVGYTPIEGGVLDFASVRVPNDGEYQSEAVLSGATYRDLRIYAHPIEGGGTTGGDSGGAVDDTAGGSEGPAGSDGPDSPTGGIPPVTSGGDAADDGNDTSDGAGTGDGGGTGADGGLDGGLPFDDDRGDGSSCSCRSDATPASWLFFALVLGLRRRGRDPTGHARAPH